LRKSRRNDRRGVSAVIGTAIALAIIFIIIIPLVIYTQGLQTLFMQEASRRLQYELERIREEVEVHATVGPNPLQEGLPLYVILKNPGTLSVSIPTIYVESDIHGLRSYDVSIFLVPGQSMIYELPFRVSVNPPDRVRVKIVTLRGNGFYSEEIDPQEPPYILLATASNLNLGHRYQVEVEVVGDYGCVSPGIGSGEVCRSRATYTFSVQEFGGSGVTAFAVMPGNYSVSFIECDIEGNCFEPLPSIGRIEVLDHTVVNFTLTDLNLPEKVPLRVYSIMNNVTIVLSGQQAIVDIPFGVSLGNVSETLKDVEVRLYINESFGITYDVIKDNMTIKRLTPGEYYPSEFTLNIVDVGDPGGYLVYNIMIVSARGDYTGETYSSNDMERSSITASIVFCGLNMTQTGLPVLTCELP